MHRQRDAQAMESFLPLVFPFFLVFLPPNSFLPIPNFPQDFPFHQLIPINYELYLLNTNFPPLLEPLHSST